MHLRLYPFCLLLQFTSSECFVVLKQKTKSTLCSNLPNMIDNRERKRHQVTTKYEFLNATKLKMFVSGEDRLNE